MFLPKLFHSDDEQRRVKAHNDMMRREAKIGGQLFGPVAPGRQREFFCLDEHTWVWHEAWIDANGKRQSVTTRYEMRPDGVLKAQNDRAYQTISYQEAANLQRAINLYAERILPLYGIQPYAA